MTRFTLLWEITSLGATVLVVSMVICLFLLVFLTLTYYKNVKESQRSLSDRDLFLFFLEQPDGMVNARRLAENTPLTLKEARSRLSQLSMYGHIKALYSNTMKPYYALKGKYQKTELLSLSGQPFLTVEDMLILFKAHDFKLDPVKMCLSTGLPLNIIKREMKYFRKEKIVQTLTHTSPDGMSTSTVYVLREPYRSNPDAFLDKEDQMNLELKKMFQYRKEDLV